jgi:hypothetical protein
MHGKLLMQEAGAVRAVPPIPVAAYATALAGVLVAFAIQEEVRGAPTLWCDETAMPIFDD